MTTKKKNIRQLDPFLEREREQYEHPLPSREYILQLLQKRASRSNRMNCAVCCI
jgi:ribonuclease R